jgi:Spy/CpxP family protein refolding chaperone
MLAGAQRRFATTVLLLTALLGGAAAATILSAAEGDSPEGDKPAKPRGRLPAYYSRVVTPEQRAEIYSIQEEYAPQIEELVLQLQTLIAERDSKVSGVLTPEQLDEIKQLKADARSRQRQPASEDAGEDASGEGEEAASGEGEDGSEDAPNE